MNRKFPKCCAVPMCKNTSIKTPDKLFINVPSDKAIRRKWFELAKTLPALINVNKSNRKCFCEDHFDLPKDMENYMKYRIMGAVCKIRMKPGCLPSKFECQHRTMSHATEPTAKKKKSKELKEFEKNGTLPEIHETVSHATDQPAKKKKSKECEEFEENGTLPEIHETVSHATDQPAKKKKSKEREEFEKNGTVPQTRETISHTTDQPAKKKKSKECKEFEKNGTVPQIHETVSHATDQPAKKKKSKEREEFEKNGTVPQTRETISHTTDQPAKKKKSKECEEFEKNGTVPQTRETISHTTEQPAKKKKSKECKEFEKNGTVPQIHETISNATDQPAKKKKLKECEQFEKNGTVPQTRDNLCMDDTSSTSAVKRKRKWYRSCMVPQCRNSTTRAPGKIFVYVPHDPKMRLKWLELARRDATQVSNTAALYCCEDHFDLPNDMQNYMRYKLMGSVKMIRMVPGCLPSRFECQPDRRKRLSYKTTRPLALKRQRAQLILEAEKYIESNVTKLEQTEKSTKSLRTSNSLAVEERGYSASDTEVHVKLERECETDVCPQEREFVENCFEPEVKIEIEIGTEVLQPQDICYSFNSTIKTESTCKLEPSEDSGGTDTEIFGI